nr:helix-turn-helix domain-containing protein [Streptomonospora nanhaiensis]
MGAARQSPGCPSRPIPDQIADKRSMMVMAGLEKPTRFNEIKRRLEGVTQRVLTQTLRRLERNGMVVRRVLPTSRSGSSTPSPRWVNRGGSRSADCTTGRSKTRMRFGSAKRNTTGAFKNGESQG